MAKIAKPVKSKKKRPSRSERTVAPEAVIVEVANVVAKTEFEVRSDPWSKIEPEAMPQDEKELLFSDIEAAPEFAEEWLKPEVEEKPLVELERAWRNSLLGK